MEIVYPFGFLALLAALPLLISWLSQPAVQRVRVSTLMLWREVLGDVARPNSLRLSGQTQRWILPLVQLVIVGCVVGALVKPRFTSDASPLVLVIDNSISMTAGKPESPLIRAKRFAKRLVRARHGNMAVYTCDRKAPLVTRFVDDEVHLVKVINQIAPSVETDTEWTIDAAQQMASRHTKACVLFLTDDTQSSLNATTGKDLLVRRFVAPRIDNLAVTRLVARRSIMDASQFEVLSEVTNFGTAPVSCQLEVTLEGDLIDLIETTIAAGDTRRFVRSYASPVAGALQVHVAANDALAADNHAQTWLDGCEPLTVQIVGPRNRFLEQAFEAIQNVAVETSDTLSVVPTPTLVVFHQTVPADLPDGNSAIINPRESFRDVMVGEPLLNATVARQHPHDPLISHVRLRDITFRGASQLRFTGDHHSTLASTDAGEPLLATMSHDQGRTLILNADLNQSDLTQRNAFPILLSNLVAASRQNLHQEKTKSTIR